MATLCYKYAKVGHRVHKIYIGFSIVKQKTESKKVELSVSKAFTTTTY